MKLTLLLVVMSFMTSPCSAQPSSSTTESLPGPYRQHSSFTDPGEYGYLYKNLPESLPDLCALIKSQIIHPFAELHQYADLIPRERWPEMYNYPTVHSILEGLVSYDDTGFNPGRKPEHRLVLGCQQNALLLTSIMRYRGIPARVRAGHATYIMPGFHVSHTVCEVWNAEAERWMLVDPSMDRVDMDREEFDFSHECWLAFRKGEIDPELYGVPHRYKGEMSILGKVCNDLASLLGDEFPINHYAPVLEYTWDESTPIPSEDYAKLDRITELMQMESEENLSTLKEIYESNPQFQVSRIFEMAGR